MIAMILPMSVLSLAMSTATGGQPRPAAAVPEAQRIILITGSTDGLGREVARRVAEQGAHVIVHGRNEERGRALVDEIAKAGVGSARFYAADLASLEEVRGLADRIGRDYPRLDVLVNNAGVYVTPAKGASPAPTAMSCTSR